MKCFTPVFLIPLVFGLHNLIVRHDVSDKNFIDLAKKYPQICHFPMGEGTLIDSHWILTAGHVGNDLNRDLVNNKMPTVTCNGQQYNIEKVIVHPDFKNLNDGLDNDISLVKIKEPIMGIKPAGVYSKKDETGKKIILVGMGDVGTGKTGPQKWDKITRAATNVIDGVESKWIFFGFDSPGSKKATPYEGISGPGDSGGPALAEINNSLYIVGVSSFQKGSDKYGKGHYGVTEYYARVSAFSKWIKETMLTKNISSPKKEISVQQVDSLKEYAGTYGFRKILLKNGELFFQREDEPLIPMKKIGADLFLWDDGNTKIQFTRDKNKVIIGFEIRRKNGEVVKVEKNSQ